MSMDASSSSSSSTKRNEPLEQQQLPQSAASRRGLTQAAAATTTSTTSTSAQLLGASRSSWSYSFAAGSEGQLTSQRCSEALTALLRHSFNLLPIVVESCSHPSGLNSLLLQPYSYAGGGLGNVDECPLLSCLALQPGRDGMPPYAGVCVPSECQATDLTSYDFVATLQRNLGTQQDLLVASAATRTSAKSAAQQLINAEQQQQQFELQMELANEYVSVFERINEINSFLPSGWTCGEWRFPTPLSVTTRLVWLSFLAMMYALLFGSVVGTYRGWQSRRELRRRRRRKEYRSESRSRKWDASFDSAHESERLLELRRVAVHPIDAPKKTTIALLTIDSDDDDCDGSTVADTPQSITPLSASSSGGTGDGGRRPLLSSLVPSSRGGPEHEYDDDADLKPRVILPCSDLPCNDEDRRQHVTTPAKGNDESSIWDDFDLYEIHSRLVPVDDKSTAPAAATPSACDSNADENNHQCDVSVWDGTECLHGIRVLSVLWIVLGHTAAITSSTGPGYSNPGDVLPPHGWANTVAGQLIFASRFAVDTFLVLSGFLLVVAASKMSQAMSSRPRTWPLLMVVSRIARILPTYLTCLGIFVFVAPRYLGSGAFWYQWQSLLQPCTEYGWTNLLFVNNFYPTDTSTTNTCFYHSWYLAVDVQVFVLGVLLLVVYQRSRIVGLASASFLFVALTVMQAVLTHERRWSLNTFDGAAVARYDVEAYAKPHVRSPSYLAGMICAMILIRQRRRQPQQQRHQYDRQLSLDSERSCSRRIHRAGTTILVLACCAAMGFVTFCTASGAYARRPCQYGEWPHEAGCGSLWSPRVTFLYTAFSRTLWVLAVSTLIFLLCGTKSTVSFSYNDADEPPLLLQAVRSILSLSAWRLPSRLSFAAYLMHPIWLFVWQLGAPSSKYAWRTATFVMQYAAVCVLTFASSYVIVLVVEAPCARLWRRIVTGSHPVASAGPAPPARVNRKEPSGSTAGRRDSASHRSGGKVLMAAGSMAPKYGSVSGV